LRLCVCSRGSLQLPISDIRLLKALSPDQVEVGATVRAIFSGDGLYYDAIVKKVRSIPYESI
jgi:hypothetical protein